MVEENLFDMVIDELHQMKELVRAELKEQFKKSKPFRMEPVSNEEMLYEYNTRGYERFTEIANTQGLEQAIAWRDKMAQIKQRRSK